MVAAFLRPWRRRAILRAWAKGKLDYSGARWALERLP